jgi:Ataxin-3
MAARLSTAHTLVPASAEASSSTKPSAPPSGFEDEDLELQAALQASLMGTGQQDYAALAQSTSTSRTTSIQPTPPTRTAEFHDVQAHPVDDPVAASMARNRAIMQRMQREQEMALNEGYDEEDALGFGSTDGTGVHSAGESSQRHEAQTASEMEEAEAIQRAVEESRAETRANDAMDMSGDDEEWRPTPSLPTAPGDRVYDDEDSELQAALKASLEGLPEGFVVPPTPRSPPQTTVSTEAPASSVPSEALGPQTDEEEEQKLSVEIDAAEMRRRRLARFGG